MTTYSLEKTQELHHQRAGSRKTKQIVAKARSELLAAPQRDRDRLEAAFAQIDEIDPALKAQGRAMVKAVMSLGGAEDVDPAPPAARSTSSDAGFLYAIRSKTAFRAAVPRDGMHTKAAITGGFCRPPAGGAPALYPNTGPVAVTALMPTVPVDGPTVRYYRICSGTAGSSPKGAAKPDAGITARRGRGAGQDRGPAEVSDELSEDAPWMLASSRRSSARSSPRRTRRSSAPWATPGILTATGAAADAVDVVADAIASMQALGTNPSAILVTPATLATIRKAKANGWHLRPDPLAAGPSTFHGVPLYAVPVAGAGPAGSSTAAGSPTTAAAGDVELGYDADDWSKNLRTARAETRGKCGVLQPFAVTKVTLT